MSEATNKFDTLLRELDTLEDEFEKAQRKLVSDMERLLPDLTSEELMKLAEQCGEETGPEHCIFCAAWHEYVDREQDK